MPSMQASRRRPAQSQTPFRWWPIAAIISLCLLVYWNALSGSFVWDDEVQVLRNPTIRDFGNFAVAFTSPFWSFAYSGATNFYRPLQTIAYMLAYAAGGLDPFPYHLMSVALHAGASLFVYVFCLEFGFTQNKSLLAAALFAAHPIHTEAVSWIAGMPDAGCGLFYFAATWAFVKFQNKLRRQWLWISSGLFLGALFCKEMALTLPAFLLLLCMIRKNVPKLGTLLGQMLPYGITLLLYFVLRLAALGTIATAHLSVQAGLGDWFSLIPALLARYVWYAVIPYPLSAYHLIPLHVTDRAVTTAAGVIILVLVTWFAVSRRSFETELLWVVAFIAMLTPVFYLSGISTTTFFAERYLYIPSIAAVVLLVQIVERAQPKSLTLLWLVAALYAGLTIARNPIWHDSQTLYSRTLESQPAVVQFRNSLAEQSLSKGDDAKARIYLESSLQYLNDKTYVQPPEEAYRTYVGMGALAARKPDYTGARKFFKQAITANPRGDWAYMYLGAITIQADSNYAEGMRLLRQAMELGPVNEVARDYMGIALLNTGNRQEAAKYFQEALRINPTYNDAAVHLNLALKGGGR